MFWVMVGYPKIARKNPYLVNQWWYKPDWPLKMTARLDLVGVCTQIIPIQLPEVPK